MTSLTNSLFILSCVIFTFCSGQESQRSMPEKRLVEKRLVEKRLVEKRLKAPLTVEVPSVSKSVQETDLPEHCLATPLTEKGYAEKESLSGQSASTDRKRFSWTPDTPETPLFKKTFSWIKDFVNKVFGRP